MEAFRPRRHDLLDPFDLAAFRAELQGELILPGSADYDVARQVHNTMYDRRPTFIVKAADAADVARTVVLAREAGMALAVRSGGHSLAGYGTVDDGIVLDLSRHEGAPHRCRATNRVGAARPDRRRVHECGGGAWPRDAVRRHRLGRHRRADARRRASAGSCASTAWRSTRSQAVEIVTADGRSITASADHHPDLFWAVRGGGGNFGVVTRFQFQLYPVGTDSRWRPVHAGDGRRAAQPRARSRRARPRSCRRSRSSWRCRRPRSSRPSDRQAVTHRDVRVERRPGRRAAPPSSRSGTSPRRSPKWSCRCRTRASTSSPRVLRSAVVASSARAS